MIEPQVPDRFITTVDTNYLLKISENSATFAVVLTFAVTLVLGVSTPYWLHRTSNLIKNRQLVIAGSLRLYLIGASPKCNEAAKKCLIIQPLKFEDQCQRSLQVCAPNVDT